MEEAPENGKESSHSALANGMNECIFCCMVLGVVNYRNEVQWHT